MVELGKEYKDKVSGFKGIATARYEFLNKCVRIQLTGKVNKDNKEPKELVFDEEQLEECGKGITTDAKRSGGPRDSRPAPREGM